MEKTTKTDRDFAALDLIYNNPERFAFSKSNDKRFEVYDFSEMKGVYDFGSAEETVETLAKYCQLRLKASK